MLFSEFMKSEHYRAVRVFSRIQAILPPILNRVDTHPLIALKKSIKVRELEVLP